MPIREGLGEMMLNVSEQKILIVDDDPQISALMRAILESVGYEIKNVSCGREALKVIDDFDPHLVLLDINMPGLSGLETLEIARKREEYVSVVLVSGNSDTEDVIKGLDAGADDYVKKPFNPHELAARVKTQLRIKNLTDRLMEANKKLQALVEIDDLTGLYNMRGMYERITLEISRNRRFKTGICVMMMDMDHFKRVNDNHDHLFGSFVLKEVGGIIKDSIRDVDFGARYGGDEFMVVLTGTDYEGALFFAERLREKIEKYDFNNGEHRMDLTTSIGLALLKPDAKDFNLSAKELVQWADRALYESKETGRNRVEGFDLNKKLKESNKKQAA